MDDEINNMRRLNVFEEVSRPKDHNVITPKWVFRRKFESNDGGIQIGIVVVDAGYLCKSPSD